MSSLSVQTRVAPLGAVRPTAPAAPAAPAAASAPQAAFYGGNNPYAGYGGYTPVQPYQPYQPYVPYQPYQPYNPYVPGYGYQDPRSVPKQVLDGATHRLKELWQIVTHPFDASKRTPVWRNPCLPVTKAETAGRWLVNGALIVGAVLGARQLMGGGFGGGGPSVGMNSGVGNFLSGAAKVAGKVVMAPVRLVGTVLSGVGNAIGGVFSAIGGGGPSVGFR